jgi:hypothetical protein
MKTVTKNQIIKDLIEISIMMNSEKKFILPTYKKKNSSQNLLYKIVFELERFGFINIKISSNGGLAVIPRKNSHIFS